MQVPRFMPILYLAKHKRNGVEWNGVEWEGEGKEFISAGRDLQ